MKENVSGYGIVFNYRGSDSCSDPCHYSRYGNGRKPTIGNTLQTLVKNFIDQANKKYRYCRHPQEALWNLEKVYFPLGL